MERKTSVTAGQPCLGWYLITTSAFFFFFNYYDDYVQILIGPTYSVYLF